MQQLPIGVHSYTLQKTMYEKESDNQLVTHLYLKNKTNLIIFKMPYHEDYKYIPSGTQVLIEITENSYCVNISGFENGFVPRVMRCPNCGEQLGVVTESIIDPPHYFCFNTRCHIHIEAAILKMFDNFNIFIPEHIYQDILSLIALRDISPNIFDILNSFSYQAMHSEFRDLVYKNMLAFGIVKTFFTVAGIPNSYQDELDILNGMFSEKGDFVRFISEVQIPNIIHQNNSLLPLPFLSICRYIVQRNPDLISNCQLLSMMK